MSEPSLLRHAPFRRFWVARSFTSFAYQMQSVAIGWQVYALTGSTYDLGMVGLAQFLPVLLLTLPAGHVADRYDRRLVARLCQMTIALAGLILAVGVGRGWMPVGGIFATVALIGTARAFESPTVSALMPGLVPAERLQQASALSASAQQTASIVGPAAGGVLFAVGPAVPFALSCALYLAASVLIGGIVLDRPLPRKEPATLRSVFGGITFIRANPALLGAISLDLFAVLLGGAVALLPVYARDILHTGPWGLGLLRGAPAVGALLMSTALLWRPVGGRAGLVMFGAVIVFGVATMVFGVSGSLPLSLAALAVLGAADVVSVVIRFSLVQIGTPDAMRGRVSAVNMLFIGTSNQLGEFESGMTAHWLGTVPAVVAGGLGTVVVALLWMGLFPALRRVDRLGTAP